MWSQEIDGPVIKRICKQCSNASHIILPKPWRGRMVEVRLLDSSAVMPDLAVFKAEDAEISVQVPALTKKGGVCK